MVNIAREYTDQLGSAKIVALLEANNCWPGIYLYLGGRLASSEVRENRPAQSVDGPSPPCHLTCVII